MKKQKNDDFVYLVIHEIFFDQTFFAHLFNDGGLIKSATGGASTHLDM